VQDSVIASANNNPALVTRDKDPVLGVLVYSITPAGVDYLKAEEKKRPSVQSIEPPKKTDDAEIMLAESAPVIAQCSQEIDSENIEAIPPAVDVDWWTRENAILHETINNLTLQLADSSVALSYADEKLERIAFVLRATGLPALKDCVSTDDLQMKTSSLAGAYQMAMATHDKLIDQIERLNDLVSELREEEPAGITVTLPKNMATKYVIFQSDPENALFESEQAARDAVSQRLSAGTPSVQIAAIVAQADLNISWTTMV
jgi:hypothetical protein